MKKETTKKGKKAKVKGGKKGFVVRDEKGSPISVDMDNLRQNPLIQLLFGHRFHGATWLPTIQGAESLELRARVANLSKAFSGAIIGVCFVVYDDFCHLVRDAQLLKMLAEKMVWTKLPGATGNSGREQLLASYNIEPNCDHIVRDALAGKQHSVSEVAQDGWERLGNLTHQVLHLQSQLEASDAHIALGILVEIDSLLADVKGWPTCVTRCSDWLQRLMDEFSASSGGNEKNTTMELLVESVIEFKKKQEKGTKALEENNEAIKKLTEKDEEINLLIRVASRVANKVEKAHALVLAFNRFYADVGPTVEPGSEIAQKHFEDFIIVPKNATELGGIKTFRTFRLRYGEWLKLGRPQTGEDYLNASDEAKRQKKKMSRAGVFS